MKKLIIYAILAVFLIGMVQPVHAGNKTTNKSWSKIKDIFK
jgi:hypothetical protein